MLQIGLIGTGYWGPNIAKSFELTGKAEIRWLCDLDSKRLSNISQKYPNADSTSEISRVIEDKELDAVAISTPAGTHYEITRQALEAKRAARPPGPRISFRLQVHSLANLLDLVF